MLRLDKYGDKSPLFCELLGLKPETPNWVAGWGGLVIVYLCLCFHVLSEVGLAFLKPNA